MQPESQQLVIQRTISVEANMKKRTIVIIGIIVAALAYYAWATYRWESSKDPGFSHKVR